MITSVQGIRIIVKRFSIFLFLLLLLVPSLASADRGVVSFSSTVRIDESGQNAIVAWNGKEEVIILSTDMESSHLTSLLEIFPLPSNPSNVTIGNFESFVKLKEIVEKKVEYLEHSMYRWTYGHRGGGTAGIEAPKIEVTFHEKIGAHDITVVKINDLDYFIDWVRNFTSSKGLGDGVVSKEIKSAVKNYLQRNIKFFVFDVIETNTTKQSIEPIIYRFDTDFLYYPMEITAASSVKDSLAQVNVFFITEGIINRDIIEESYLWPRLGFDYGIELNVEELSGVSSEVANLFDSNVYVMYSSYTGPLEYLKKDVVVYEDDIHIPTITDKIYWGFSLSSIFLFLSYISSLDSHPIIFSLMILSFILGVPTSMFLISKSIEKLPKLHRRRVSILLLLLIGMLFASSVLAFPAYTMILFSFIFGVPLITLSLFQLYNRKMMAKDKVIPLLYRIQLYHLLPVIVILLLFLPQPIIGRTFNLFLLAIITIVGFVMMIKIVIKVIPSETEPAEKPENLYEQLLYVYRHFYGGGRNRLVLEHKIKSLETQGLRREEAIRKLAEKEKLIEKR